MKKSAAAAKRKAPAQTPQPAKKSKNDSAPASAPAKVSLTPSNEKEYTAALKSYLQQNGPCKLGILGSKVKRPASVPKLKQFLTNNKERFNYNATTDTVSLA